MFQKNPLRVYSQIFDCPFPLELSIYNVCAHRCHYCFSELGRQIYKKKKNITEVSESYEFDPTESVIKKFAKAMSDAYNPKDPVEYFIRNKYPVVYSNTTDPFSPLEAKTRSAEKLLAMFADYQYPVFLQTKNPYFEDDYLPIMEANKENMIIYVTLSMLDPKISEMIEPGTPSPIERMKKIEKLTSLGFDVVVALNPYIDGLSTPVKEYVEAMDNLGVLGIWFDYLHLNRKQKQAVQERGCDTLIPYIDIPKGRKIEVFKEFVDECRKHEMLWESVGWNMDQTGIMDHTPYLNTKFDKVMDFSNGYVREMLNEIWEENGRLPVVFNWQAFKCLIESELTDHVFSTHKFFNALNNSITMNQPKYNATLGKENTLENILRYAWNGWDETMNWLWKIDGTHVLCTRENVEGQLLSGAYDDDNNDTVMVFHKDGGLIRNRDFFLEDWGKEIVVFENE